MRAAISPPLAIVRPVFGLANRLRAVTSTLAMAEAHGLRGAILWEPGSGFSDEPWTTLFATDVPEVDRAAFESALARGVPMLQWGMARLGGREVRRLRAAIRRQGFVFDEAFQDVGAVLRDGALRRLRPSRRSRQRHRRALVPAPALAHEVQSFLEQHDAAPEARGAGRAPLVGVHIRRGDANTGDNAHAFEGSTDQAFGKAMDALLRARPAVRFLVATDDAETLAHFTARYGERVIARTKPFARSVFDEAKGGQADAVVDLFLLAQTRAVLGSRGSTFGRLAARIRARPFATAGVEAPGQVVRVFRGALSR